MNKQKELEMLRVEMETAKLPLKGKANLVFGEGNVNCDVLIIGEAPGFTEDMQRRPFVGRSGQLLDKLIGEIKWLRKDVYITNIVKRRPPENRDPTPEEIEAYKPYLARQIEIISPKIIATLGRFSMNYFLPQAKISHDHGRILELNGRTIFPLYHPAAALRATSVMEDLRADFKKLSALVTSKKNSLQSNFLKERSEQKPAMKNNKLVQSKLF